MADKTIYGKITAELASSENGKAYAFECTDGETVELLVVTPHLDWAKKSGVTVGWRGAIDVYNRKRATDIVGANHVKFYGVATTWADYAPYNGPDIRAGVPIVWSAEMGQAAILAVFNRDITAVEMNDIIRALPFDQQIIAAGNDLHAISQLKIQVSITQEILLKLVEMDIAYICESMTVDFAYNGSPAPRMHVSLENPGRVSTTVEEARQMLEI